MSNPEFVTIAAAPGQTPVLTSLTISSVDNLAFNGLKVQRLSPNLYAPALIRVADQGASYPTSNIVFENMTMSSQDNVSSWSQAEWVANARNGFAVASSLGADTSCITMTGSHITNVRYAALAGNVLLFSGNEIDHFGDDGIDYGGSQLTITKNYIHDNLDVGDGNHNDAMQGIVTALAPGTTVNKYQDILISDNTVIRQTDGNIAWPVYLQGIDAFDADWTNLTITNNVVVTSACWGIAYSSIHNGMIANNTVVDDKLLGFNCSPAISVGDKTHEGSSSADTYVRNNLATVIEIDNLDTGITAANNVGISSGAGAVFFLYVNGVGTYFGNPGPLANANIIAGGGPTAEFVNFDPAGLTYNMLLKKGGGHRGRHRGGHTAGRHPRGHADGAL
jgi:hypothetical protein